MSTKKVWFEGKLKGSRRGEKSLVVSRKCVFVKNKTTKCASGDWTSRLVTRREKINGLKEGTSVNNRKRRRGKS